ncbi:TolC family protein [Mucilaginibacter sp.]|uniref:TolC family protein n=1 Tax=Mucilaginibacter sp. TaxID=1882438 RepID=UPI002634CC27|nr:TolC family protein [Mucilaginibacter sp.]MDB4919582.1 outer membrane protein TolC [Mucilaginibacter sp.]
MKTTKKLVITGILSAISLGLVCFSAQAQQTDSVLTLQNAINIALSKQQIIKAKDNYAKASAEAITGAKRDGLPDFILSAQQSYGTINGLNGTASGLPGLTTITAGPIAAKQNWNAAFGAFYSSNIDWNIFSFGLQKAHVAEAKGIYNMDTADLEQEKFQQQVRVAGAYLNLLAAQRLHYSMDVNLSRVSQLRDVILVRAVNGLNPGVDSTIANAELSKARIAVTDAINYEQSQAANLSIQLGVNNQSFSLDSSYISQLPARLPGQPINNITNHPELNFLSARVKSSELSAKFISKTSMPRVSFFGVLQDRGSGFGTGYNPNDPGSYNRSYLNGIDPIRGNYLVGVGVAWNLTDLGRVASRVKSQHYNSDALTNEYNYLENNLNNQLKESNKQLTNAMQKYREAPIQLKAASDAYQQKKTLYSNGLATIVDVTQTLYNLNRAETDKDIATTAVWQSLLYMAASSGNFNLFINQF